MESSTQKPSLPRAIFWGIAASSVLAGTIVLMTWFSADRSLAQRAMTDFVMPVALLWLLFFAGAVASLRYGHRRLAISLATIWLLHGIIFNGSVTGAWLASVEYQADRDPVSQIQRPLDAVVVLGGYASINRFGVPELAGDGQRLLLAAQMWHAGRTEWLICTGDSATGTGAPREIGRSLLVSIGVPDEVIFDVGGLNTTGEMSALRDFFDRPPERWSMHDHDEPPRIGLVTSAFHMPRALRLAAGYDLEFVPLPCAFRGGGGDWTPRDLIPNVGAGRSFAIALKERLARLVGR
ncbi:MAG: ElyC/SanA/YdcF family protein [Planctomycetota bacterium]